jgi:type VI secretion system protein ImpK
MRIIDAFVPVFEYVENLTHELVDESNKTVDDVHNELKHLLKITSKLPFSSEIIDLALFGIYAFIDEKILESNWNKREEWSKKPLQQIHFDTNNAGDIFFSKLDELNDNNDDEQQIREVYLYCLVQGFSGCYFDLGEQSFLQELIQKNHILLSKNTKSLFLESADIPAPVNFQDKYFIDQFKENMYFWAPIFLILVTYFALRNDLLGALSSVLNQI